MGHYEISIEPRHKLLRMTLSGFFTLDEVASLGRDRATAMAQLGGVSNQHLTLCDIREMKISAQDVVAAFTGFAEDPRYTSRRLAIVNGSSLARMQAKRVAARENVAYFENPDEAERWLLAD